MYHLGALFGAVSSPHSAVRGYSSPIVAFIPPFPHTR